MVLASLSRQSVPELKFPTPKGSLRVVFPDATDALGRWGHYRTDNINKETLGSLLSVGVAVKSSGPRGAHANG